ncbi:MAG TPA: MarR family transcriptional regulator [Candidatus Lokiarchaeia archaeon]
MIKRKEGGFLIAKIHQLSGRIFEKLLKNNNINEISPAQGRILFVLWENDNLPIYELSKKTQLKKSTLTSMLDRLEKKGYIKRSYSEQDRRLIIIKRTEKDNSFQDLYKKVSEKMIDIFYSDFKENEITDFEYYLKKILNNLESYEEKNK